MGVLEEDDYWDPVTELAYWPPRPLWDAL
jgi:hypothetical protein